VEALALRLVVGAEPEEDLLLAGNHTPVGHWQMGATEASNQAGGPKSSIDFTICRFSSRDKYT